MRALATLLSLAAVLPGSALPAASAPADAGLAARGAAWLGPRAPPDPRRVVTLAPSATDLVLALGEGRRIVGVTRYDRAPEVNGLPRVGGFLDPSPEAVAALRPDLVLWITDGGALAAARTIGRLGVPVLALPVVSVEDVIATAREVAEALGAAPAGARLARELEGGLERVRARARGLARPRVLFVVGREPLVVAGPGSYPDELLRIAGARNVVEGRRPWPVYPLEKAVADDPDLVIDAAYLEHGGGGEGRIAAIPAVRHGRLVRLEDDDALRPGPRMVRALERLFAAVHPEAERP